MFDRNPHLTNVLKRMASSCLLTTTIATAQSIAMPALFSQQVIVDSKLNCGLGTPPGNAASVDVPAGQYVLTYVAGCYNGWPSQPNQWGAAALDVAWNGGQADWPALGAYPDQASCNFAYAGSNLQIDHGGGPISFWFPDTYCVDNIGSLTISIEEAPTSEQLLTVYFDSGLSLQTYCQDSPDTLRAYVVLENAPELVTGVQFMLDTSAAPNLTFEYFTKPVPGTIAVGSPDAGIVMGWAPGQDASSKLHVLTVTYSNSGCTICSEMGSPVSVVADPAEPTGQILYIDGTSALHSAAGGAAYACSGGMRSLVAIGLFADPQGTSCEIQVDEFGGFIAHLVLFAGMPVKGLKYRIDEPECVNHGLYVASELHFSDLYFPRPGEIGGTDTWVQCVSGTVLVASYQFYIDDSNGYALSNCCSLGLAPLHRLSTLEAADCDEVSFPIGALQAELTPFGGPVCECRAASVVTLETDPAGLEVQVTGETFESPRTFVTQEPSLLIGVSSPQTSGSDEYSFASWSDGGAMSHIINPSGWQTLIAYFSSTVSTGVVPEPIVLRPNFPNPFNPRTTIQYSLSAPAEVDLSIYDLSGRLVKTLLREVRPAGSFTSDWDATDEAGNRVASGSYLLRMKAGDELKTQKMILIK